MMFHESLFFINSTKVLNSVITNLSKHTIAETFHEQKDKIGPGNQGTLQQNVETVQKHFKMFN